MKNEGKRFFSGVLLLTLSGAAVKVCGLLFKIPLVSVIGEEGMGYFSSAYVIYTFFYVLSTSGLPVGLSILVAGTVVHEEKKRYLLAALLSFGALGTVFGSFMMIFHRRAAALIGNPGAALSIFMMGPALIFVCLSGGLRGYFQGQRKMLPTAVSQMIEAVLKTALGVVFAACAMKSGRGAGVASAMALFGVSAGSALSFMYLLIAYFSDRTDRTLLSRRPEGYHFKRLFSVVFPVGAASMVMSVTSLIDLSVMMRRLQASGMSADLANRLYGSYSGVAVPLFNLPSVLIAPVAAAVIPYLAAAVKENDRKAASSYARTAMRLTLLLSLPCAVGLGVLARPILTFLFGETCADNAAPMLLLLAPSVVFTALQTVSGAILQGGGRRILPVFSIAAGSAVKLVSGWFLIGRYGMIGAPIGTLLCCLISSCIDLCCLKKDILKKTGFGRTLPALLCAAAICGGVAASTGKLLFGVGALRALRGAPALFLTIGASALSYLAAAAMLRLLDDDTLRMLPGGEKIAARLRGRTDKGKNKNERKRKKADKGSLQL